MLPSNYFPNKETQVIVNKHIYFLCNIKHIYRGRYLYRESLPKRVHKHFFPISNTYTAYPNVHNEHIKTHCNIQFLNKL